MLHEHPDMLIRQESDPLEKQERMNLPSEIQKQVSIGVLNVVASKIPIEAILFPGANPILSALYVATKYLVS